LPRFRLWSGRANFPSTGRAGGSPPRPGSRWHDFATPRCRCGSQTRAQATRAATAAPGPPWGLDAVTSAARRERRAVFPCSRVARTTRLFGCLGRALRVQTSEGQAFPPSVAEAAKVFGGAGRPRGGRALQQAPCGVAVHRRPCGGWRRSWPLRGRRTPPSLRRLASQLASYGVAGLTVALEEPTRPDWRARRETNQSLPLPVGRSLEKGLAHLSSGHSVKLSTSLAERVLPSFP
jgi:hypothetical protein